MTRMQKALLVAGLGLLALLAACASGPPEPDWRINAVGQLQRYEQAWLAGRGAVAERAFASARAETARTGRADLVARVELTRCALHVASLDFGPCEGFAPLEQDAGRQERAYARYLRAQAHGTDVPELPPQHRAIAAGGSNLSAIADPLARLVAAGVLLQQTRITPEQIAQVVDTASEQGWRRPLLAWLGVQLKLAEQAGDVTSAAQLRRRMDLVQPTR